MLYYSVLSIAVWQNNFNYNNNTSIGVIVLFDSNSVWKLRMIIYMGCQVNKILEIK